MSVFGKVYYDPACVGNILSFGNAVRDCKSVEYLPEDDCYLIHDSIGKYVYRFSRDESSNTYQCNLDTMVTECTPMLVMTVAEKMKKYTVREVRDAELAKDYQRRLGYASAAQTIKLLSQGQLTNSKVTARDVHRAIDIWGPDLGCLKGKTTSHQAKIEEKLPITGREHEIEQIMYIDIMFVNQSPYLVVVVQPIEYLFVSKLANREKHTIWNSLKTALASMAKHRFRIKMIRVDGEGAINTEWFHNKVGLRGIILDTTGAGEAVAVVERKIRHIKERVRSVINTLPYNLTDKLEIWLVKYAVSRIVLAPTRNTIAHISPREKLCGRKIDVDKEIKHGFGDYVQVHNDVIDNSTKPRTHGAIALMSSENLEGSWYYMLLSNQQIVKRTKATCLPMPNEIILHLNNLSASRKSNRVKQPVFENSYTTFDDDDDVDDPEYIDAINYEEPTVDVVAVEPTLHTAEYAEPIPYVNEMYEEHELPTLDDIVNDALYVEEPPAYDAHDQTVDDEYLYDDTPVTYDQALIDDIFGLSDDENEVESPLELPAVITTPNEPSYTQPLPDAVTPELRRSARNHQPGRWNKKLVGTMFYNHTHIYKMTVNEGINKLGVVAVDSIKSELKQMCDKNVWEGVTYESLTQQQKQKIISSSMFLKEKYTADGMFEKLKSRLVAGGHLQDRDVYNNGASPTASTTSVFILTTIAAKQNRAVATIDFPGAFLNSDMPLTGDHVVYMRLSKQLTNSLIEIDPTYNNYLNNNGTCIVKLKKALYGCVESAKLWYDKLSGDLIKFNYTPNKYDICVFNRTETDNTQSSLVIHVDDMIITASSEAHVDAIITEIETIYPGLTKHRGRVLNYIGMTFDFNSFGQVKITMDGFIHDLLEGCKDMLGVASTPARPNLFDIPNDINPLLPDNLRERFHSITAKLLYLCKRTRPDILTVVAFLTKRVLKPQRDDYEKLIRAIQYIRGTKTMGITFESYDPIHVIAYIDASFAIHPDKKSHTGSVITLGKGAIYAKSGTQRLLTKSSTEAELVGLSDSGNQVLWTRNFLEQQGHKQPPAVIYQDNQSTIQLIRNGRSNSERTRHVDIRYFFLHDRMNALDIDIQYLSTREMIADILTKPLQGELFRRMRNGILNLGEQYENSTWSTCGETMSQMAATTVHREYTPIPGDL